MTANEIFDTTDLVVFVAGGTGAIGAAIGQGFVLQGSKVAFAGIGTDQVVDSMSGFGDSAIAIEYDGTVEEQCQQAIDKTVATFGRIDVIVNAIGGGAGRVLFDAETYPRKAWDWIMEINLRATVLSTQAAVRQMISQGGNGKVLNICSVRAQLGIHQGYSAYVAAKGAIASLTRQWATEWAHHSINVNAISPTFVDTPQVAMLLNNPEFAAELERRIPLGRVAQTEDIVGPALFLCSPASGFITGQIVAIDGGVTACQ